MPRHRTLVFGLLTLALILAVGLAPRPVFAADHPETAAHAPHAAEAPEENPNILAFRLDLAFWSLVVFVLLLVVLKKAAWGPLIRSMHEREEHLEHVLLTTEQARNESEKLLAEHRRQMLEAEDRARALLEEARVQGAARAEELMQKARAESEAEQHRARREIETARDQALGEIWSKTADLAVAVAGKVLARNLNDDEHRRLVEAAVNDLPASPNGHGGGHA